MEAHRQLKIQIVGWVILGAMLSAGFLLLPLLMSQMGVDVLPEKGVLNWLPLPVLVIAFPVMAAHLYVMVFRKYLMWLSYWLAVAVATLSVLFLFRQTLGERVYPYQTFQGMFFFSSFVGGTLGGMIGLGIVRQFAPRWLSVNTTEQTDRIRHRIKLKNVFIWTAAIAFIVAALTNPENFLLENRLTYPLYVGPICGAVSVGLFCVLILVPTLVWLNVIRPFWLGKITLLVCSLVLPMAAFAFASILIIGGGSEMPLAAVCFTFSTFWLSVYAIAWNTGLSWGGITDALPDKPKPNGFLGFIDSAFLMLGKSLKYFVYATTVASFVFALVWSAVHCVGGKERAVGLINNKIHDLLDSQNRDAEWIDEINRQRSADGNAENNVALKVIRIINPYRLLPKRGDTNVAQKHTLQINDSDPSRHEEIKRLGLTLESLVELPVLNEYQWFHANSEEFLDRLRTAHPDIAANYDAREYSARNYNARFDAGRSSPREKLALDSAREKTRPLSRAQKLANFFIATEVKPKALILAPWSDVDCALGAQFVETYRSQTNALIELSKESAGYYAPLTRLNNGEVLPRRFATTLFRTPYFLLQASGYNSVGNGDIDSAIEGCESLWRFIKLSNRGAGTSCLTDRSLFEADCLAKAIVFSDVATESQKRRILKSWSLIEEDDASFAKIKKLSTIIEYDQAYQMMTDLAPMNRAQPRLDPPFVALYEKFPRLVNWQQFVDVFTSLSERSWTDYHALATGKLSDAEYQDRSRQWMQTTHFRGVRLEISWAHEFFDKQLFVFLQGPKAKGQMLAELFKSRQWRYDLMQSFRRRRETGRIAIALEIYKTAHDEYPNQLQDLVPDILPAIHKDPVTLTDFVYLPSQEGYKLYSIGVDMSDDGGDEESDDVFVRPWKDLVERLEGRTQNGVKK